MSFADSLRTIFEIILVAFVVWAVFNEARFVAFEERLVAYFRRRRMRVIRGENRICSTCRPCISEQSRRSV